MSKLTHVDGSATSPLGSDKQLRFIIHCCNDIGAWGSGFVLAVDKLSPKPKAAYQDWYRTTNYGAWEDYCSPYFPEIRQDEEVDFALGQIQPVQVKPNLAVVNMIGQRSIGWGYQTINGVKIPPIRYEAINEALWRVAELAKPLEASIHCPQFGAGLAGGEWSRIEGMIKNNLVNQGLDVTVYHYKG